MILNETEKQQIRDVYSGVLSEFKKERDIALSKNGNDGFWLWIFYEKDNNFLRDIYYPKTADEAIQIIETKVKERGFEGNYRW